MAKVYYLKLKAKVAIALASVIALTSCTNIITDQYQATALTTYTWQVEYSLDPSSNNSLRFETFDETSLLNRNGQKPATAVTGPDDQGLWWPALPPRPTIDQVESRQRPQEQASSPQLLKSVKYQMIYKFGNTEKTLPTNYRVYRQVVKAYPERIPLRLTLGVGDNSVEKAEPVHL